MPLAVTLIESLALVGSRKSDGTVNAGGRVHVYSPSTTNYITTYQADSDGVISARAAGVITLDSAGKAGIFIDQDCDLVVETSAGATVSTTFGVLGKLAETVIVTNTGFTGTLASGASGAGGKTTLDAVLSNIYASVGGLDGKFLESAGATARTLTSRLGEMVVSVKDFNAKGDGSTDDTVAIQAAINRVIARGGGTVFFPQGTYLITAALTITPASTAIGVILRGAGGNATTIKSNSATANVITATLVTGLGMFDFLIEHNASSSGIAISLLGCDEATIERVRTASAWAQGLSIGESGATPSATVRVRGCRLSTRGTTAGDCAIRIGQGAANTTRHILVEDSYLIGGSGATIPTIAIAGLTTDIKFTNNRILGATNGFVLVDDGTTFTTWSGVGISFCGNHFQNAAGAVVYLLRPSVVGQIQSWGNTFDGDPAFTNNGIGRLVLADAAWALSPLGQYLNATLNTATIAGVTPFTPRLEYGNIGKVTLNNAASSCEIQVPTNAFTTREGTLFFLTVIKTAGVTSFTFHASIVNNTGVAVDNLTGKTYTAVMQYTNSKWMIIAATHGAS